MDVLFHSNSELKALNNVFTNRCHESRSWGDLAIGLECLVFSNGNLSILDKLSEVLILEISANSRENGEETFSVDNTSLEV